MQRICVHSRHQGTKTLCILTLLPLRTRQRNTATLPLIKTPHRMYLCWESRSPSRSPYVELCISGPRMDMERWTPSKKVRLITVVLTIEPRTLLCGSWKEALNYIGAPQYSYICPLCKKSFAHFCNSAQNTNFYKQAFHQHAILRHPHHAGS